MSEGQTVGLTKVGAYRGSLQEGVLRYLEPVPVGRWQATASKTVRVVRQDAVNAASGLPGQALNRAITI